MSQYFEGFQERELSAAFDLVANPADWRDEIKCWVPSAMYDVVECAVRFYTGTKVRILDVGAGMVQVHSVGYRMGPCGS